MFTDRGDSRDLSCAVPRLSMRQRLKGHDRGNVREGAVVGLRPWKEVLLYILSFVPCATRERHPLSFLPPSITTTSYEVAGVPLR